MKGMKGIKCSVNLWVFQVLLAGIVHLESHDILLLLAVLVMQFSSFRSVLGNFVCNFSYRIKKYQIYLSRLKVLVPSFLCFLK